MILTITGTNDLHRALEGWAPPPSCEELVIDCPEATQLARVCVRRGLDATLVRGIIAQQASRSERLAAADDVLVNDGPLEQLAPRVQRLHRQYCECAHKAGKRL